MTDSNRMTMVEKVNAMDLVEVASDLTCYEVRCNLACQEHEDHVDEDEALASAVKHVLKHHHDVEVVFISMVDIKKYTK